MNKKKMAFEQRIEQDSKNYYPKDLFDMETAGVMLEQLNKIFGLDTLMTDRHGSILMTIGDFGDFKPDVVNRPGNKIRVKGRTVCHIYAKYDNVAEENFESVSKLLGAYIDTLEDYSEKSYLASEQAVYIDELEQQLEKEAYQAKHSGQNDPLTGVLNRNCFISHMKELAEREVVPTAAICVNINDWRFVDNNYGEEESDRLIVTVAEILKDKAAETGMEHAVIGRVEGDVFNVLLPLAEEDAAKEYCDRIQQACDSFEDAILAPSIAVGCVMRTNVEESFKNILSDAEYAMLENKFTMKNAPGYKERLEKGLKKAKVNTKF
ncbi:MAG: GGDEF domain-containing protein [Lachnospiraceae bacterium]|nr:GGDEF domain-containing protein [Lachnospiraceae bacterium]